MAQAKEPEDCQTGQIDAVVRVQMRQEDPANISDREPGLHELVAHAASRVDQIHGVADNDGGGNSGPFARVDAGQPAGPACCTERDYMGGSAKWLSR